MPPTTRRSHHRNFYSHFRDQRIFFAVILLLPLPDAVIGFLIQERACVRSSEGGLCGIAVQNEFVDEEVIAQLRSMCSSTAETASTKSALTVYEFESNGITHGDTFTTFSGHLDDKDLTVVNRTAELVLDYVTQTFKSGGLNVTAPLFLSSINASRNDSSYSFWHVDKDTKEHFDYSALLYLEDGGGVDFDGGNLAFQQSNGGGIQIVPRAGRLVAFSSGAENPHKVRLVRSGVRRALTMFLTRQRELRYEIKRP